jgi:hypothetical protein
MFSAAGEGLPGATERIVPGADRGLDEAAVKWCLPPMNTVVRKSRLWWRTS